MNDKRNYETIYKKFIALIIKAKLGTGLLKRPRNSAINTEATAQRYHLLRCFLDLIALCLAVHHN